MTVNEVVRDRMTKAGMTPEEVNKAIENLQKTAKLAWSRDADVLATRFLETTLWELKELSRDDCAAHGMSPDSVVITIPMLGAPLVISPYRSGDRTLLGARFGGRGKMHNRFTVKGKNGPNVDVSDGDSWNVAMHKADH